MACENGVLSANGDCAPINGELSTDCDLAERGVLGADCCDRTEAGVLAVECDLSEVGVPGIIYLTGGRVRVCLISGTTTSIVCRHLQEFNCPAIDMP